MKDKIENKKSNKKKIIFSIGVIILVLFVGAMISKDYFIKKAMLERSNEMFGSRVNIGEINTGLFNTSIEIKGLKLNNSGKFGDNELMADITDFYADPVVADLKNGYNHFKEIRLDVKEFVVVKTKDGAINIALFNSLLSMDEKRANLNIEKLKLKVDKIVYKDYSVGDNPKVEEFIVNFNEESNNITSPKTLFSIIDNVLKKTTI